MNSFLIRRVIWTQLGGLALCWRLFLTLLHSQQGIVACCIGSINPDQVKLVGGLGWASAEMMIERRGRSVAEESIAGAGAGFVARLYNV